MGHFKWNYIAVGVCGIGALISAMTHQAGMLIFNLIFLVLNWYLGEQKVALVELALKELQDKESEEEPK